MFLKNIPLPACESCKWHSSFHMSTFSCTSHLPGAAIGIYFYNKNNSGVFFILTTIVTMSIQYSHPNTKVYYREKNWPMFDWNMSIAYSDNSSVSMTLNYLFSAAHVPRSVGFVKTCYEILPALLHWWKLYKNNLKSWDFLIRSLQHVYSFLES